MTKLYRIVGNRKSAKFLDKTDPDVICDYLTEIHPELPDNIIDAMALAIIYSTYLQLVFEEEGNHIVPSMDEFDTYIWAAHDKKTLH